MICPCCGESVSGQQGERVTDLTNAMVQRDRAVAALREWPPQHRIGCPARPPFDFTCNCGLDAALAELEES